VVCAWGVETWVWVWDCRIESGFYPLKSPLPVTHAYNYGVENGCGIESSSKTAVLVITRFVPVDVPG